MEDSDGSWPVSTGIEEGGFPNAGEAALFDISLNRDMDRNAAKQWSALSSMLLVFLLAYFLPFADLRLGGPIEEVLLMLQEYARQDPFRGGDQAMDHYELARDSGRVVIVRAER